MNGSLLKTYLKGWSQVCSSTPQSVADMLAGAHPDIVFSDVNSPHISVGHPGIETICEIATRIYPGVTISYGDLLSDGSNWSIRWTLSLERADGTSVTSRGASAGKLDEDGRVIEHTDYWNAASIAT